MKFYSYDPLAEKEMLVKYRDALIEYAGNFSEYKAKKYYRKFIREILSICHAIDEHYKHIEPMMKNLKVSEVVLAENNIIELKEKIKPKKPRTKLSKKI